MKNVFLYIQYIVLYVCYWLYCMPTVYFIQLTYLYIIIIIKIKGNGFFRDGKYPDAIKEYEEACKRDPTNPAYYNNLAAALLKLGSFNDAKREVEKSLELDRTYVKAWAKKGDIEYFMKEYHKALDSYKGMQIYILLYFVCCICNICI